MLKGYLQKVGLNLRGAKPTIVSDLNSSQEVSEGIWEESQIEFSKEKNKSGVEEGGGAATAKLGEEEEASAEDSREAAATTLRDNQSGAEEEGKTQGTPVDFKIRLLTLTLLIMSHY